MFKIVNIPLYTFVNNLFNKNKVLTFPTSRYITLADVNPWLASWKSKPNTKHGIVGKSVLGAAIPFLQIGTGQIKILAWSQMHGNESTTTKMLLAICDWLLSSNAPQAAKILSSCTLLIIPVLNPDGAVAYTRENANKVDLNRDAQALSQPESQALRNTFNSFKPNLCLNLHGQRTIYGIANSNKAAAVAFLAPAADKDKSVNATRKKAMELIVGINSALQEVIPGQVARYDDSFNKNCVGDTFQGLGCPTILFEAGQQELDYNRNNTCKTLIIASKALLLHLSNVAPFKSNNNVVRSYNAIPENVVSYCDLILKQVHLNEQHSNISIAIQYKEQLEAGNISFIAELLEWGKKVNRFGHQEIDFHHKTLPINPNSNQSLDDFIAEYALKNFSR